MLVPFSEYPYKNHEYMTNLNFNSPIALTKAILPHMLKNKSGKVTFVILRINS